jgi:FdhE protein
MELVDVFPAASELLKFYCRITTFQDSVFEDLSRTGQTDLKTVARHLPELRKLTGIDAEGDADFWESTLRETWENSASAIPESTEAFLSRTLLQPYAEYLASRGNAPKEGEGACPFCGGKPAVGVLRQEGDGGKRSLICSLCATEWLYRRIVCPNCGESDKDKLPVYKAEGIDYVRVEACDSCHCYLKSVDLTVNGLAVPVVDELATVALNVWAEEAGYIKLQSNLLGL